MTFNDPPLDLDCDLLVLVPCMEVRRIVIIMVHEYDNAVKAADLRHLSFPFSLRQPAYSER